MRSVTLAVLFLSAVSFLSGAYAKTNDKGGSGTTATVCTAAFTSALTNPSIIVVTIFRATNTPITPTDTALHTYVDGGQGAVLGIGSTFFVQIYYVLNTATTVTNIVCESDVVGDFVRINAMEWTGNATSSAVDVGNKNPNASSGVGGGQNVTSNAATTTGNGDLVVGVVVPNAGTLTVGTGFTQSVADTSTEYQVQAAAGSIAATWHDGTNNDTYGAVMTSFKPAGGAATTVKHRGQLM